MASNALTPSRAPLDFMECLSPIASLHKPDAAPDPASPKLIFIFSWMAAQDAHIAKYVAGYQALYPSSPILLVRCPLEHTVLGAKPRREVSPAVSALRSILPQDGGKRGEDPEMILHLFSNGGCTMFQHFMDVFGAGDAAEATLPRHVCVMDSCPGSFDWMRTHRAISQPFPAWARPLMHLVIVLQIATSFFVEPVGTSGGRWGLLLNEVHVLKVQDRRVYLYADGDDMVDPRDVERHAEEARMAGAEVETLNFGTESRHVAHARADPERYWGAVKRAWEGK